MKKERKRRVREKERDNDGEGGMETNRDNEVYTYKKK